MSAYQSQIKDVIKGSFIVFLCCGVLTGNCQAQMDTSLAARWKLDEGSGTKAADASGNNFDGTLSNGSLWGQGLFSASALLLDGASGYVQVPNGILDLTQDFSIALWVKPASFNILSDNNKQRLLSLVGKDGGTLDLATFPDGGSAFLSFITTAGGGSQSSITSDSVFEAGYWHLVVLVFNGGTYAVYVNGQAYPLIRGGITNAGQGTSYIGNTKNTFGPGFFNGTIEDVQLYRRALSPAEITQYYDSLIKSSK